MTMHLIIPGRGEQPVESLAEASREYSRIRDDSDEGASTFPEAQVYDDRGQVARISYNGRCWAPGPWSSGDVPLYDPSQES